MVYHLLNLSIHNHLYNKDKDKEKIIKIHIY
jgi:hypothetical protein